jgi:hypothetical protein
VIIAGGDIGEARAGLGQGEAAAGNSLGIVSSALLVPTGVASAIPTETAVIHQVVGHVGLVVVPARVAGISEGTVRISNQIPISLAVLGACGSVVVGGVVADTAVVFKGVAVGSEIADTAVINSPVGGLDSDNVPVTVAVLLADMRGHVVHNALVARIIEGSSSPGSTAILDTAVSTGLGSKDAVATLVNVVGWGVGFVVPRVGAILDAVGRAGLAQGDAVTALIKMEGGGRSGNSVALLVARVVLANRLVASIEGLSSTTDTALVLGSISTITNSTGILMGIEVGSVNDAVTTVIANMGSLPIVVVPGTSTVLNASGSTGNRGEDTVATLISLVGRSGGGGEVIGASAILLAVGRGRAIAGADSAGIEGTSAANIVHIVLGSVTADSILVQGGGTSAGEGDTIAVALEDRGSAGGGGQALVSVTLGVALGQIGGDLGEEVVDEVGTVGSLEILDFKAAGSLSLVKHLTLDAGLAAVGNQIVVGGGGVEVGVIRSLGLDIWVTVLVDGVAGLLEVGTSRGDEGALSSNEHVDVGIKGDQVVHHSVDLILPADPLRGRDGPVAAGEASLHVVAVSIIAKVVGVLDTVKVGREGGHIRVLVGDQDVDLLGILAVAVGNVEVSSVSLVHGLVKGLKTGLNTSVGTNGGHVVGEGSCGSRKRKG